MDQNPESSIPPSKIAAEDLDQGIWPEALSRNSPALSAEEQKRLLRSCVAVAGLGGLGGHLCLLLARAGVGRLILIDDDDFDETNTNRQPICTRKALGKAKARQAARAVRDASPFTRAMARVDRIEEKGAIHIFSGADLIVDGLDNIASRRAAFAAARTLNAPFVHGAVSQWSGQAATFFPADHEAFDRLFHNAKEAKEPPAVLSPAVAVIAGIQAAEAIRILAGRGPALRGQMIHFDGERVAIRRVNI
ncbi:MAG: ThiF family adenylyltransferase [Thermodesulfobacteriota bacterium]